MVGDSQNSCTFAAMNPLYHHIEQLLLSNPCVVIPQFGAFVAMDAPACYVESEQLFFPPVRHVRFNTDITADDGLLVSAVSRAEACSSSDAKRLIQTWILDLRQQLLTESQVDINSLGTLYQDEDGNLTFEACQSGITLPAYFGLDAFSMPRLSEHALRQQHQQQTSDEHITIHIHKRTLRNAIAIAACVVLCVVFSKPVSENMPQINWASLFVDSGSQETKVAKNHEPITPATPATPAVTQTANSQSQQLTANSQQQPSSIPCPSSLVSHPAFAIVVASATTQRNAEAYVLDLQQRGFTSAHIDSTGNIIRVILAEFPTETAAYNFNHQLHDSSEEFATSWVLSL